MPVLKQAKRAVRVQERKRRINQRLRRKMREAIKTLEEAVEKGEKGLQETLSQAYKAIDKAAKRNIIHANNAARKKSRLARLVKEAQS